MGGRKKRTTITNTISGHKWNSKVIVLVTSVDSIKREFYFEEPVKICDNNYLIKKVGATIVCRKNGTPEIQLKYRSLVFKPSRYEPLLKPKKLVTQKNARKKIYIYINANINILTHFKTTIN